jgi:hypothetical protein
VRGGDQTPLSWACAEIGARSRNSIPTKAVTAINRPPLPQNPFAPEPRCAEPPLARPRHAIGRISA